MPKNVLQEKIIRYLVIFGITGLAIYTAAWLVLGSLDPTHTPTQDAVSNLSAIGAPYAPFMTFIIIVLALSLVAFAIGLHRGLPSGVSAGPTALVVAAIGYVGIAFTPLDSANLEDPGTLHLVWASVTFFGLMLAPILTLPKLRRDSVWRSFRGASIVATVLAFVISLLVMQPALVAYQGLFQRIALTVPFIWMWGASIRLLKTKQLRQ